MLEGQLALYSKNVLGEKVKEQMSDLLVDKNKFESLAKESLRRAQEERCEALQRLADVERSLLNAGTKSSIFTRLTVKARNSQGYSNFDLVIICIYSRGRVIGSETTSC